MIRLASDHLLFRTAAGEYIPVSTESISVELTGAAAAVIDPEVVKHAAAAAVHYFRHHLDQESVSAEEFAGALEKVLRGFGFEIHTVDDPGAGIVVPVDGDLGRLAGESGVELTFFQGLRQALRQQLDQSTSLVRFHSLRSCVKRLTGAQRWCPRCAALSDQIVEYLRRCLTAEKAAADRMLVVE